MKIFALSLTLATLFGCNSGPACADATKQAAFVRTCTDTSGHSDYCQCTWDYLAERHTCTDLDKGAFPASTLLDACNACAPKFGGVCNP